MILIIISCTLIVCALIAVLGAVLLFYAKTASLREENRTCKKAARLERRKCENTQALLDRANKSIARWKGTGTAQGEQINKLKRQLENDSNAAEPIQLPDARVEGDFCLCTFTPNANCPIEEHRNRVK